MARQTQGMGGVLSPGAAASSGARSVLLQAERLRAAFGTQDVFSIDRLELREGDRVALVGMNGAGKTTLMRALAGDGGLDVSGTVTSSGGAHYQPQLEDGDAQAEQGKLSQWGAKDLPKSGASGGERMRRKLAAAFSASANILLLDEPTANLDMQGVAWLERELKAFRGAVVIVSHDRMLMDNVCRAVWELDGGALTTYPGNYSDYWRQRAHARESAWREYRAYREEAARLKGAMREKTGKAAAVKVPPKRMWYSEGRSPQRAQDKFAKQAKDIASRLEHLEKVERPPLEPDLRAAMRVETPIVSRTAAYVRDFTVRYGSRTVLGGVEATVLSGQRTVIMGPNGAGKTTLLRALLSGDGHVAAGARVALLDQQHEQLDLEKTLLENAMRGSTRPEWTARAVLARLGLGERDVRKPTRVLSGGERAKTLLAKLLISGANFLAMDEPTNYLDLYALHALEELLSGYEGTLLLVTHDRTLADAVADRLLWVEDGEVAAFEGGYSAFAARKEAPPADALHHAARAEILRMRMAELGVRIDRAKEGDKPALEDQYRALAGELREALNGTGGGASLP